MIFLNDILEATRGRIFGDIYKREFSDFCYDSRLLNPGELFLAVRTERADGHDYIESACQARAGGILCEEELDLSRHKSTCIVVNNTKEAIKQWASFILKKYKPEVIGVTGSVGKTSTKEAIAEVLDASFKVFKSHGNYNDLYGLPISLGKLLPEHQKAVLEMACDSFNEIEELCQIAPPTIGVITQIGPAHLEYLGSIENIAREKGRLIESLPKEGFAILNYDDELVRAMSRRTQANVIFYGTNSKADIFADDIVSSEEGIAFKLHYNGRVEQVTLSLLGRHNIYTALAATSVGIVCGLSIEEILKRLSELVAFKGRLNPLRGINNSLLIDDSYNANPLSTLAALDVLAQMHNRRKIAILGDMLELGSFEETAHRQVGRRASRIVDYLITKGDKAELIAEEAKRWGLPENRVFITYTPDEASKRAVDIISSGDVILVKGSPASRMEIISESLLADRTEAKKVLVRQNSAWKQIKTTSPRERPTWIEVDLNAIAYNVRRLKEIIGNRVELMAVLKADGYGHGAVKVGRTALNNSASQLGVACLNEGITLRQAGIIAEILILGYTPAWQARDVVKYNITATLYSMDVAEALSRAATSLNTQAKVHIKVDTGMGRLGLLPEEVLGFIQRLRKLPNLIIEGIFTHFAKSDCRDKSYTIYQLSLFKRVLRELSAHSIHIPYIHTANSAAVLEMPETHFNLVRPGIAIYGLNPSDEVKCPPDFKPALSFKTQVAQVKKLPAGSYISYGCTYRTDKPSKIAVLPVGYGDGFRGAPANWKEVLVRGRRAPIVGVVCMDQCMIDVTDIPGVRQGDEVVLIGEQGEERITVDEVAKRLGTINFEVVAEILARVPRVW